MINRTLMRTKIVQTLFAYYKTEDKAATTAEKELLFSFQRAYDLYHYMLWLPVEIRRFAEQKIEAGKNKRLPKPEDLNPNMRFVENRVIRQLEENVALVEYLEQNKLSWSSHPELIQNLYQKLVEREFYQLYMSAKENNYNADLALVKKIYERLMSDNEFLADVLEGDSIHWATDLDTVLGFIQKTLRGFEETDGGDKSLMEMFDDANDAKLAIKILRKAIAEQETYKQWVSDTIKNWDAERLAYMDSIILQTALAEICNIPSIPVTVSINEYMELSKEYSSPQSSRFINGVLDTIVKRLGAEGKLKKAMIVKK